MAMTMLYEVGDNLYVNVTNKCPCHCTFCIRKNGDGAYGSDSLWLEREPSAREVIENLEKLTLDKYKEIVFCGYGEPLERIDDVVKICDYLRAESSCTLRLNTNGLSDLIHQKKTAHLLRGRFDIVSISLNAGSEDSYMRVTNPEFGDGSYKAVLRFAADCVKYIPKVMFTVVDVISPKEIETARYVADTLGLELRVRKFQA